MQLHRTAAGLAATCILLAGGCGWGSSETRVALSDEAIADYNAAVGLMGQFRYDDAHKRFEALVKQYPDHPDLRVNLAIARLNRQFEGDEPSALKLLAEVLKQHPDHLRAHYCSGLLLLHGGKPAKALKHFQKVAKADPRDPYAAYYIGQCHGELGRMDQALKWFQKAARMDPYLRSATYAAMLALRRQGREEEAAVMLDAFKRLEGNPQARTAEFKYTRMGPKSIAYLPEASDPAPPLPKGDVFASGRTLRIEGAGGVAWAGLGQPTSVWPSLTACDMNGDEKLDLFAAAAMVIDGRPANAVLLAEGKGYRLLRSHPFTDIDGVQAALWGDCDNDGLADVYFCRKSENQLWRQTADGQWNEVASAAQAGGGKADSVDGAIVDADHDGDLDILFTNADGPLELLSNNMDGTFRPLAAEMGLAGDGGASLQPLFADLDSDRDADLVVLKPAGTAAGSKTAGSKAAGKRREADGKARLSGDRLVEAYLNDRLWQYTPARGLEALATRGAEAILAADADANGSQELYTANNGEIVCWQAGKDGAWLDTLLATYRQGEQGGPPVQIAITDLQGDGRLDLAYTDGEGWSAIALGGDDERGPQRVHVELPGLIGWLLVHADPAEGPSLVALRQGEPPLLLPPGPGRHRFAGLTLWGKVNKSDQLRSNASGIGVKLWVRVGSRWTALTTYRVHCGPGQSLQPLSVGLGGAKQIDFVQMEWSDGVSQTETGLASSRLHRIEETQRQLSSCPVLFAWDGGEYRFITDLMGVGGLGFAVAPGEYAPARGFENLLLPDGLLEPRQGRLCLKLHEPMEEVCYVDSLRLVAYDLPPGWRMTLDERMGVNAPHPTGAPRFFQHEALPSRAVNDRGRGVLAALSAVDGKAAPPGAIDRRFLGRTAEHAVTISFDQPLDAVAGKPVLIMDGWIEYPYSQTMFAAWQAGADYRAPSLAARGRDGKWHDVLPQFGYPAGMPRQASVPLDGLPAGTTELRLATNQEIYWDRLAVAWCLDCPQARRQPLNLARAELLESGFPHRTTGLQRFPVYDYSVRRPLDDMRHPSGLYTAFGGVGRLLSRNDDALCIFGPGEEIHLEFEPPAELPGGWTRQLVLETAGWCKDMDLFTKDPDTVEPLPAAFPESSARPSRQQLHRQFQTRYESGL